MEFFLGLIGLAFAYFIVTRLLTAFLGTAKAAGRAAMGKGSFGDNLQAQFQGMGPFQIRTSLVAKGSGKLPFDLIKVEGKGIIPTTKTRSIKFVTSVLDITDDVTKPVLCTIERFQESETTAYQHQIEAGQVSPDQGYISWAQIGSVIPEILTPPRKGKRTLSIIVRIVDEYTPNQIMLGYHETSDPALIASFSITYSHNFESAGYEEAAETRTRVSALAVRLAVAVAMADGDLAEAEGRAISNWVKREIAGYSGERSKQIRQACNEALKSAYEDSANNLLSLSPIVEELNEIANDALKYQAIELCLDVMAADGVAGAVELDVIRKVAEQLNLDYDELQKLKDQRLVTTSAAASDNQSLEGILGIDPSWDSKQINKHLRTEFAKWNGRMNTLTDADERENTQRMLDLIAEARIRYG